MTTTRRPAGERLATVLGLTAMMAAAAAVTGFTLPGHAQAGSAFTIGLPLVVAIAVGAELASVDRRIGGHNHTLSLSEVGLVIGLAFAAPADLVLGRALAALIVIGAVRRVPGPKLAYNTALFGLETAVAAAVYHSLIGDRLVHEPVAWLALAAAVVAASVVGLCAVRGVLRLHGATPRVETAVFSMGISATGAVIGIVAVVALSLHTEAALLVAALCAIAFAAMRKIARLLDRLAPES